MSIQFDDKDGGLSPTKIEEGVMMDVLDALDQQRYLKGDKSKPMRVRVRSIRCKAIDVLDQKVQRRVAALNKGRRVKDASIPTPEFVAMQAAAVTAELHHFSAGAAVQSPSTDDLTAFFKDNVDVEDIRDQIWQFANNDQNYGSKETGADLGNDAGAPAAQTERPQASQNESTDS